MTVRFEHRTVIDAPAELVFDLSLDIDLHRESMAGSGERAVAGVITGRIGLGQEVTWRATHFHHRFTMTTRITALDRPHRFVDEQARGPFHAFHHEHVYEEVADTTVMTDRIVFDAPLGAIGRLVERAVLGDYLGALIVQRATFLKAAAERG